MFQLVAYVICGFQFFGKRGKMTAEGFEGSLQLLCQLRSVTSWFTATLSGEKSCRRFSALVRAPSVDPVLAAAEIYGQRKSQIENVHELPLEIENKIYR